jgi:DNA processing protein
MAHEAALACSAKTVVVLGSGLLCPYPHEHKNLFDRIVQQGGCVLSPFYMTAQPEPWRFPVRNRIIAGMSRGVLIVQAAQKSGAHSTASCALEYGREVFAVPGLFHDELSAGCHRLIKQGAVLVSSAQDILQELEPQYVQRTLDVPKSQVKFQDLNLREKIIYVCRDGACVDDLVQKLGVPMEQIYHELFTLQLDGVITQDFAGLFHAAAF